jgi:hypothetical protein
MSFHLAYGTGIDLDDHPTWAPLRRPCDDPESIFAANRGKWREERRPVVKRIVVDAKFTGHSTYSQLRSANNPNHWQKCRAPDCKNRFWKGGTNGGLCAQHRNGSNPPSDQSDPPDQSEHLIHLPPASKGLDNPNNFKKCSAPGCEVRIWKAHKFCPEHRTRPNPTSDQSDPPDQSDPSNPRKRGGQRGPQPGVKWSQIAERAGMSISLANMIWKGKRSPARRPALLQIIQEIGLPRQRCA